MNTTGRVINIIGAILLALFLAGVFESGCGRADAADLLRSPTDILLEWFTTADNNFHKAVMNNELAADDPIIPCFDALVGTQNPNAQPYDTSNLGGVASVGYIKINSIQAKKDVVGKSCNELTGKFVGDMLKNAPVGIH